MIGDGTAVVETTLWRWQPEPPAKASWFFVTITGDVAVEVRMRSLETRRGFGSVRVTATVGSTTWQTSLFRSGPDGDYLLPVKAAVRSAENLAEGDGVRVRLSF